MDLTKDGKDIVFIWIPGHVGIRGNWAADPCWRHLGWTHPLLRPKTQYKLIYVTPVTRAVGVEVGGGKSLHKAK